MSLDVTLAPFYSCTHLGCPSDELSGPGAFQLCSVLKLVRPMSWPTEKSWGPNALDRDEVYEAIPGIEGVCKATTGVFNAEFPLTDCDTSTVLAVLAASLIDRDLPLQKRVLPRPEVWGSPLEGVTCWARSASACLCLTCQDWDRETRSQVETQSWGSHCSCPALLLTGKLEAHQKIY